jgi:hypothetical protein
MKGQAQVLAGARSLAAIGEWSVIEFAKFTLSLPHARDPEFASPGGQPVVHAVKAGSARLSG